MSQRTRLVLTQHNLGRAPPLQIFLKKLNILKPKCRRSHDSTSYQRCNLGRERRFGLLRPIRLKCLCHRKTKTNGRVPKCHQPAHEGGVCRYARLYTRPYSINMYVCMYIQAQNLRHSVGSYEPWASTCVCVCVQTYGQKLFIL